MINRRQWLYGAGALAAAGTGIANAAAPVTEEKAKPAPLDLSQYEPKSMLQVHESHIERAKFPVIDFHTHISLSTKSEKGVELSPDRQYLGTPQELLAVMDRKNIKTMVNLTGGYEKGLAEAVAKYDRAFPGPLLHVHRAVLFSLQRTGLSEASSSGHRASSPRRCARPEDSQDAGTLSSRKHHFGSRW